MIIASSNIIISIILDRINDEVNRFISNRFICAASVILSKKYIIFLSLIQDIFSYKSLLLMTNYQSVFSIIHCKNIKCVMSMILLILHSYT